MFQFRTRIQTHRAARSRSPLRGRSPRARPLVLEALEDRCLLSSYSFTPIADTSPGSPYSGLVVGQAINNLGQAAFVADLKSGGEAIYRTERDGRLTTIAQTDALIRDFYLAPYMNDSGTVAFGADLTDGTQAIFTGSGGDLTRIADTGPDSPLSSLPPPGPRIGSDGTVTSQALLVSGAKLFFVGNGGLLGILYVTGGRFSEFPGSPASQVNGNTVAFRATLSVDGTRGVFTGSGGPTTTIVTSGSSIYSSFISVEINDAGDLAIDANRAVGGMAIVTVRDGKLTPFVDTDGPFSQFFAGRLSINNQGTVIFGADLAAGGHGIFQGPDPIKDKILTTGDPLDGSTVAGFPAPPDNYLNPRGLNNAGQIIFRVDLADGRRVLVRADPDSVRGAGSGQSGKFEVFINLSGPDVSPSLVTTTQELKGPGPAAAAKPDDESSQLVYLGSLQGIQSQRTQPDYAVKIARGHSDLLDHVFADLADSLFDHAL